MARVVIVGAGIGGLSSALLLARAGQDVVVCERDPAEPPVDAESAWSAWARPGTPQARLGHSFLPGFRSLLESRLCDVFEEVLAAGAPLIDHMANLPGGQRRPGDEQLVAIAARRPVLEAALCRRVASERRVRLLRACRVTGLVVEAAPGHVPTVTGVRTAAHGVVGADTVILAGGRSAPVVRWLREIGASIEEEAEGCGSACYTRYFRLRSGAAAGGGVITEPLIHREGDCWVYEIWGADAGTFAAEIVVPVANRELHDLRHEHVWTAAALSLPDFPDWIDPERSQPITPGVDVMGQERNVLRQLMVDDRPAVRGLHVIGDARCQTDSLFAWGCGNALTAAVAVTDAMADHPRDPDAQAVAVEARVGSELAGRFRHSRERDRAAMRVVRGEPRWSDPVHGTGLIDTLLAPAAGHDPKVWRAVNRWELQLDPADALDQDASLVDRARRTLEAAPPEAAEAAVPSLHQVAQAVRAAARSGGARTAL